MTFIDFGIDFSEIDHRVLEGSLALQKDPVWLRSSMALLQETEQALERHKAGVDVYSPGVARNLVREKRRLTLEIQDYHARHEREAKVLKRGWEPWEVPVDMHVGTIEDQREEEQLLFGSHRWDKVAFGLCMVASVPLCAGLVGVFAGGGALFGFMAGVSMLVVAVVVTMALVFTKTCRHPNRSRFVRSSHIDEVLTYWHERNLNIRYVGSIPRPLWDKYRRDRHLFDRVYVASRDERLFDASPAIKGDPFLVGAIGDRWYLGGQWDIGREIRFDPSLGGSNDSGQ